MFPFRDRIQSRSTPWWTYAIIAANVAVFAYELSLSRPALERLFHTWGVAPQRVPLEGGDPAAWLAIVGPALVSMFLHGGWLHLILNLWYLWIFGDNVEDRLGHSRYLALYLGAGLAATAAHVVANPGSPVPTVGASGAIAGVLGAYAITYPRARVEAIIPLFIFIHIVEVPAWLMLGFWFVIQFASGAAALATTQASAGGVAWWAHVGGFVAGIALMGLLSVGRSKRKGARG